MLILLDNSLLDVTTAYLEMDEERFDKIYVLEKEASMVHLILLYKYTTT